MPPSRVRMSMVVWAVGPVAELEMSFCVALEGRLFNRELIDFVVGDLLERTVRRIKVQLESRPLQPSGQRLKPGLAQGWHRLERRLES